MHSNLLVYMLKLTLFKSSFCTIPVTHSPGHADARWIHVPLFINCKTIQYRDAKGQWQRYTICI